MANLRNTAAAPAAARSGETVQEVRDRWSGEISTTDYPPVWNDAGTQMGSRSGMVPPVGGMNGNGGQTSGIQFIKFLVILPFTFQLSLHLERGTHHAY